MKTLVRDLARQFELESQRALQHALRKMKIQRGGDNEAYFKRVRIKAKTSLKRLFSEAMPVNKEPALRDSRAGSSVDAMIDLVEVVRLAESTWRNG